MYSTSSEQYLEQTQTCELCATRREISGNASMEQKAIGQTSFNSGNLKKTTDDE